MVASLTAEQHELSPCSAFGAGHLPTNCLELPQNKSLSIQIMLSMAPTEVRAMDLVVLQVLVELAQERDEDIPALVYEARPAGRVAARQRQQQSPAELQGVTVEGHTPGCPTEGANHLCLGSAKHLVFLCLLGSGTPNMQIDCCRMTQYMQLSLSTWSTVMEWGPASHLMQRPGWLHCRTLTMQVAGVVERPAHRPCCSSSSTPATTLQLPGLLGTLPGWQWTPLGWPPWE